jgi:tRNA-dihydrouridine synthase B
VEFARIAEGSGAQLLILHPRSKTMGYTGHSFWERIALVKKAVSIPVIGNGDILTADDAGKMRDETGCDGIMIGRGALGNPWLFNQVKEALAGRPVPTVSPDERCRVILQHIENFKDFRGEEHANKEMRKHIAWYLRGLKNAAIYRDRVFRSKSSMDLKEIVKEALCG